MPFKDQTLNSIALEALAFFDFDSTYRVSVVEHRDYVVIGIVDHNVKLSTGKSAYCHMRFEKTRVFDMDSYEFYLWIANVFADWQNSVSDKNYETRFANGRKSPGQPSYRDWM